MFTQIKVPHEIILNYSEDTLERCAHLLQQDELVAVPTETVYGLAGNALSENAVRKIFNVKGRPLIDPLITHFKCAEAAFSLVYASAAAETLAAAFWPGPLTLILEKRAIIPDIVTAGLSSAAIRVPRQPMMQALLQRLNFPLAAPSANPFGYVSPTRPEHVAHTLGSKIAAILDGGACAHGIESTVLDLRDSRKPQLLRPGPIYAEAIETVLSLKVLRADQTQQKGAQLSPGQLTRHYSPNPGINIIEHGQLHLDPRPGEAVIANRKPGGTTKDHVYWLSETGDLVEIARNFFDLLQKLDRMDYQTLSVEAAPELGIGLAFNDRLRRAASVSVKQAIR